MRQVAVVVDMVFNPIIQHRESKDFFFFSLRSKQIEWNFIWLFSFLLFKFLRYLETLMHLLRGNIGAGVFGMGDAFKNGGIILAPTLTVMIGVISVHCQHVLVISLIKIPKIMLLNKIVSAISSLF